MAAGKGRYDLWLNYGGEQFVIALKLYYNQGTRDQGLEQTARHLSRFGLSQGYLIIFETRAGKTWEERIYREVVAVAGKTVILLGM